MSTLLTSVRGPKCRVGLLVREQLAPEDAQAILAAVEAQVSWADLSRVLRNFGHKILAQSIARHFKGECACPERAAEAPTYTSISEALTQLGAQP